MRRVVPPSVCLEDVVPPPLRKCCPYYASFHAELEGESEGHAWDAGSAHRNQLQSCCQLAACYGTGGVTPSMAMAGSQDVGELVHAYGRQFLHRRVQLALEYYMLAARAAGDALPAKGRLLKELLTESKAYGAHLVRV